MGLTLAHLSTPPVLRAAAVIEIEMRASARGEEVWFDPIGLWVPPGQTVRWVLHHDVHTTTAYHPANDGHSLRIPEGAEPGPTFVYAREILPTGVARMPVGTMLLKTIENGPPTDWFVHAMVKRSGDFNPGGTVGWEFFELALTDDLEPVILWRGEGPPSGHGYAAAGVPDPEAIPLVCNDCHSAAWMTDGVLSPELVER